MENESEVINLLREKVARLEERLSSADKALTIAQSQIDSSWQHLGTVISIILATIAVMVAYFKK